MVAFTLLFSLTACGGEKKTDEKENTKQEDKNTEQEEKDTEQEDTMSFEILTVSGTDMLKRPENIELLTDEKLQEVTDYFNTNNDSLTDFSYDETASQFGVPGAHFLF